jgi:hypothetical protein
MATIFMQNIVLGFGKFLASLEPSPAVRRTVVPLKRNPR